MKIRNVSKYSFLVRNSRAPYLSDPGRGQCPSMSLSILATRRMKRLRMDILLFLSCPSCKVAGEALNSSVWNHSKVTSIKTLQVYKQHYKIAETFKLPLTIF